MNEELRMLRNMLLGTLAFITILLMWSAFVRASHYRKLLDECAADRPMYECEVTLLPIRHGD